MRVDEKRVKGAVRETAQEAHQDAVAMLERRNGNPVSAMTIAEILDEILKDCDRRERRAATSEFYKSHLGVVARHFGPNKVLATITVGDVQDFIDKRRETVAGLTIKHDLMALTRAIRFAGIEPNPVKSTKIIRPRVQKRDPGLRLAWSEVMDVLHKISGNDYAVLAFVAGTGVRRTEFARMRHEDIDLLGDRIVIPVGNVRQRQGRRRPQGDGVLRRMRARAGVPARDTHPRWLRRRCRRRAGVVARLHRARRRGAHGWRPLSLPGSSGHPGRCSTPPVTMRHPTYRRPRPFDADVAAWRIILAAFMFAVWWIFYSAMWGR
ncbi:MAG TPA: hypothetical protein VFD07_06795 [Candidatus Krumholzibacteria bacterium]|nr:hypothetical protein [Candidatus Krumholzibacteria bacterium]